MFHLSSILNLSLYSIEALQPSHRQLIPTTSCLCMGVGCGNSALLVPEITDSEIAP